MLVNYQSPGQLSVNKNFHFILITRNHVRIVWQSILQLRQLGYTVTVFDLEFLGFGVDVKNELRNFSGIDPLPITSIDLKVNPGDNVVLCSDWSRTRKASYVRLINHLRQRECKLIGIVEGCRWGENIRYRNVDAILAYAPIATDVFRTRAIIKSTLITGSPIIEGSLQKYRKSAVFEGKRLCVM